MYTFSVLYKKGKNSFALKCSCFLTSTLFLHFEAFAYIRSDLSAKHKPVLEQDHETLNVRGTLSNLISVVN